MDKAARDLNSVLSAVQKLHPDRQVALYLDGTGNLNLMIDPQEQWRPNQQFVAHKSRLNASSGDW